MLEFENEKILSFNTAAIEDIIKRRWGRNTISPQGQIIKDFREATEILRADPNGYQVKFVYDENLKSIYMIHLLSGEKNKIFPLKYIERETWHRGRSLENIGYEMSKHRYPSGIVDFKLHFYVGNMDESLTYPIKAIGFLDEKPVNFIDMNDQKIDIYDHGRLVFFL